MQDDARDETKIWMHWDTAHKPRAQKWCECRWGVYKESFFIATVEMTDKENASSLENHHVTNAAGCSQELSL